MNWFLEKRLQFYKTKKLQTTCLKIIIVLKPISNTNVMEILSTMKKEINIKMMNEDFCNIFKNKNKNDNTEKS